MNLKSAFAAATGFAFIVACSGEYKLGDGNQRSEGTGGAGQGAEDGSTSHGGEANAGGSVVGSYGGQGADPSFGGDPGIDGGSSRGGGSYGGAPGIDGGSSRGGGSYGGAPGIDGGSSFGGDPGVAGGSFGGGSFGGDPGIDGGSSFGGGYGTGGQTNGAPPEPGPYTPSTPGVVAEGAAPNAGLIGNWVGYVENFRFPSGSDALSLSVSQTSQTELTGHLTVGQGSGALPSLHVDNPHDVLLGLVEGFAFTAMNGRVVGSRLVFDVAPAEAWGSYCSAQTPWPGYRSCGAGAWGGDPISGSCTVMIDGQWRNVDCGVLYACTYVCRCDDTSCFADTSVGLVHFDVTLRQPYLDGSAAGLVLDSNSVLNVHFSPQ